MRIGIIPDCAVRRDLAVIAGMSIATAVICVRYDLSERLFGWSRAHERLQVDELPAVLLVVAICLIWFSWRRYLEARRQLDLRVVIEGKLAEALADNQRLAQQYVDMQECERKALARDLHDELGQYLNVVKLDAVSIRDAVSTSGTRGETDRRARHAARAIIENVDRIYGVVASLIRQLRPVAFDELGVAAALEHCVADWRARLPHVVIGLSIEADAGALDENRALALFRLVQEGLTNVARHAQATRVQIRIIDARGPAVPQMFCIDIVDNGRGADLNKPHAGLGLIGMRERVAAFGGSLEVVSHAGAGYKIQAMLPVRAAVAGPHPLASR